MPSTKPSRRFLTDTLLLMGILPVFLDAVSDFLLHDEAHNQTDGDINIEK